MGGVEGEEGEEGEARLANFQHSRLRSLLSSRPEGAPTPRPETPRYCPTRLSPGTPPTGPAPSRPPAWGTAGLGPKFPISWPRTASLTPAMPSPSTCSLSMRSHPFPVTPSPTLGVILTLLLPLSYFTSSPLALSWTSTSSPAPT